MKCSQACSVRSLVLALCLTLLALAAVDAKSTVQLKGAGSSQSGAIYSVWVEAYRYYRDVVQVSYDGSGTNGALTSYAKGTVDFVATERGLKYEDYIQFPLAGQGIVMGYNLPALSASDPTLILNRTVLGSIWAGSITQWNDTAIQELNPAIAAKLPAVPIKLGYSNDTSKTLTFTEVFKLTLESFSPEFNELFNSNAINRTFALLPRALEGFAVRVGGSSASRISWLQKNANSLTWLNYAGGLTAPSGTTTANTTVNMARMYNKAGSLVSLNVDSLHAAMNEYQAQYRNYNFGIDILDADGTNSWPMSYLTFFAMRQNQTVDDCSNVGELLDFVAWIHTNDEASDVAEANLVAPLDVSLRKQLLNLLNNVHCNGDRAFSSQILVGTGGQLTLINSLATSWSTNQYKLKYYQTSASTAETQLATLSVDFGIPASVDITSMLDTVPDATVFPLAALPLVAAYSISDLNTTSLVLTAEIIARILINNITFWNDPAIRDLNITNKDLPAKRINFVFENVTNVMETVNAWLGDAVPWWKSAVGATGAPWKVVNATYATDEDDFINQMTSTGCPLGFGPLYDIRQARVLGTALLKNQAGIVVEPSLDALQSAVNDYSAINDISNAVANSSDAHTQVSRAVSSLSSSSFLTPTSLVNGEGEGSWPLATFASIVYRRENLTNCDDAVAMFDFFRWTQLNTDAKSIANKQGFVIATEASVLQRYFLNQMKFVTCNGEPVSILSGCINDDGAQLCSGVGVCNSGTCSCPSYRTGQYCENTVSGSSSDTATIVVATVLPVSALFLCLLLLLVVLVVFLARHRSRDRFDWEIRYEELELSEQLASGGFGQVYRATWKGTEVAVKVIAAAAGGANKVTKDMERSFKEEVRVMTALRHPNVVLFMAASTKAPNMCIVMEFMTLGSLHDLLHNELVPDIPQALKVKMAYQASKGMHFLHSSGIVHRDLKSLNLLLDNKWNLKVSDFGLTGFKEEIKRTGAGKEIVGSLHWTAPEVLNESHDADLILADVYSFGIIMWELLTRSDPYLGLSPAAVAVAVIRDGLRPTVPLNSEGGPEWEELMTTCWHQDPTVRPTFLEIMTRLSAINGDSSVGGGYSMTGTSHTSTSSGSSGGAAKKYLSTGSWSSADTPASGGSTSSSGSNHSSDRNANAAVAAGMRPPEGDVTIVFSDITRAASLWEFNAVAMRDATLLHNECLRTALQQHRGYEVAFLRDRNSGEGSFCMAFQHAADALAWCCDVQSALLEIQWPEALLEHPGAAEEWADKDDRILFKGLRVRMGVHSGPARPVRDPMTRRIEYIGPVVNTAARITAMTHGGQIVLSSTVQASLTAAAAPSAAEGEAAPANEVASSLCSRLACLGKFEMPDAPKGAKLYELRVEGLQARFFGGVTLADGETEDDDDDDGDKAQQDDEAGKGNELLTAVGEGMMFKEDTFLTSANLCRWIINFSEIQMGKQIGLGSYGVVFRGRWKGVDVAVKRFIKQKLDERRMLEFRAEMAFLSELQHPNIVLFIGACVKKPNLAIVTEFMKRGSLHDVLIDHTIKLPWELKMRLLRGAALGVAYLHSLEIIHRDLKPSNLLVDENWNVKVADFGFARIKEENATMTRCGTPCWTAPEIIRGERTYTERADVFSFGIIMWQVATRKEPFAGRNFMGVSLDVLEGRRPQIPSDLPADYKALMTKAWHAKAEKRPDLVSIVSFLQRQVDDDGATA